ncbi:hypothetical protein WN55_02765 [Dufourea novaeangliae]|uniref:Uncharacterized protein n=1 Tax=Dufourea novaeangliae TaxID=178035 RepID=A0A154NXR7_DUFNO|nr:hypothetical protein WN55_02765 [Dufourea novaeangliae]
MLLWQVEWGGGMSIDRDFVTNYALVTSRCGYTHDFPVSHYSVSQAKREFVGQVNTLQKFHGMKWGDW